MQVESTGKALLLSAAALTAAGGILADFNKTHIFNTGWPPHAKFHDAMTILLGSMLGTTSIVLLQTKGGDKDLQLKLASLLPTFFWSSMIGSFTFPGAKGLEAEFPEKVTRVGGLRLNEGVAACVMLSLISLGYLLEKRRLK